MTVRRVSAAFSRATRTVVSALLAKTGVRRVASLEQLEGRQLFATYVVDIEPYLTQGNAGNANTGTLTLKEDNRIEDPAGATEDDRIKTAIDAAIQSASATTTPPGTTYSYPNTSRFKIAKFSGIAGLTIPAGYTSDDWVIGFEDLTDNDFNDGFWAVKVEVDDGYGDDESEAEDDTGGCPTCGAVAGSARAPASNSPSPNSDNPLSYHDGTVRIAETDFVGGGFGQSWSITRNWSNELTLQGDNTVGNGWMLGSRPYLQQSGNDIKVVTTGRDAQWFAGSGGTYTAQFHTTATLAASGSDFIYRSSTGQTLTFYGFGSAQPGQLKELVTPGGSTVALTYASGQLTEVSRSQVVGSDTIYERYVYTYLTSGDNIGKISNIDQQRKINAGSWSTVREADYSYYNIKNGAGTADDPGGNVGDLKRVVVKDGGGNTITTSYYRYWEHVIDGSGKFTQPANGYVGGLKYVVTGASYDRLAEAVGASNVDSTSDGTVATYANHYFEFNKDREATKEIAQGEGCSSCTGGLGTFSYVRTDSAHAKSFNNWAVKTVETLPDGNENIVYTNGYGKIMLKAFHNVSSGQQWIEYWRYDSNGRVIRHASPSAVTGYDDANYADLVNYNSGTNTAQYLADSAGIIEILEYGASTTATTSVAGNVAGYLKSTSIQNGDGGTPILQSERTYIVRTGGSNTIYPVASETRYENTNGTGAQTTTYTYTWHGSTTQMLTRTVTLPTVSASENGSGSGVTEVTYFDTNGRAIWVVDGDGYITFNEYDTATGALVRQIRDANPSNTTLIPNSAIADYSAVGRPTRSGSLPTALELVTSMTVDNLGRVTKVTDPNGNVTYTVYDDDAHEKRVYRGWNATTGTTTGPIEVTREDRTYKYGERLTMSATPSVSGSSGSYVPTGTEAISNIQSLTRDIVNDAGQVVERIVYTSLSGTSYSATTAKFGTVGTNYLLTTFGYDQRGRQSMIKRPDGSITRTVYDGLGRAVTIWKGTNDSGATNTDPTGGGASGNNMVKVSESIYDAGGVGDSNLTESRQVFGNGGSDYYSTIYAYDFRNRVTKQRTPDNVGTAYTYDNLGRSTQIDTYGDGIDYNGDYDYADSVDGDVAPDFTFSSGELRDRSTYEYDDQGQLFRSRIFEVNNGNGTVGDKLSTNYWYDGRGNEIKTKSASGLFEKTTYDGAGRVTRTAMSVDSAELDTEYSKADDLASDQVIEQNDYWLDKGGRTRIVTNFKRAQTESTGTTGALNASNVGYHTSVAYWYDAANRTLASADYGRDGSETTLGTKYVWNGTAYIDSDADGIPNVVDAAQDAVPGLHNFSTARDTAYDWIYTAYAYDAAGRLEMVTDNADHDTKLSYDLAGRKTKVVENYVNGTASETETDTDRTTEYVYDNFGRLNELKALRPLGSGNGVETQTTTYLYASDIDRSWLSYTLYPDSTSTYSTDSAGKATISTGTDHESDTFDRLGRTLTSIDQRGVEHSYTYDPAGRLWADRVTSLGSSGVVDGTVRRIQYRYNDAGYLQLVSSFDSDTAPTTSSHRPGTVLNEVSYTYDDWDNSVNTRQEHNGAMNYSTSPSIVSTYVDGAVSGEAKYVRLDSVSYPDNNGTTKGTYRFVYESSTIGQALSRLEKVRDNASNDLIQYDYVGAYVTNNRIYHPQVSGGLLNFYGTDSGSAGYECWDRYGRLRKVQWQANNGSTNMEQWYMQYDRMGNRIMKDSNSSGAPNNNWDEEYFYDGLNRLVDFKRGIGTDTTGDSRADYVSTTRFRQQWTLDALGNWREFDQTNSNTTILPGVPSFTQDRTANAANEITGMSGPTWASTSYDAAGNMTQGPKTGSEATTVYFKYDGWNRLAGFDANGDGDLLDSGDYRYSYDGNGRRITKFHDTANDGSNNAGSTEEFYYNDDYQVVEVRVGTVASGSKTIDADAKERYLWDQSYIDTPAMVELDTNTDGTRDYRLWPTYDANFNITALVTDAGKIVERYVYTPYGERLVMNGARNYANSGADPDNPLEWTVDTNGSDFGFSLGFQGLRKDEETGLWQQRARYSLPVLQFTQRDPLRYVDGANMYVNNMGNPINMSDPAGTSPRDVMRAYQEDMRAINHPPLDVSHLPNDPNRGFARRKPMHPDAANEKDDPSAVATLGYGTTLFLNYIGLTIANTVALGNINPPTLKYGQGDMMVDLLKNSDAFDPVKRVQGINLQNQIESWARANPSGSTTINYAGKSATGLSGLGSNMMLGQVVIEASTTAQVRTEKNAGCIDIYAEYQFSWFVRDDHNFNVPVKNVEMGTFYKELRWRGEERKDHWTIKTPQ